MNNRRVWRTLRVSLACLSVGVLAGQGCPGGSDTDGDGLSDVQEAAGVIVGGRWEAGVPQVDRTLNGEPAPVASDPTRADTDGDGVDDGVEVAFLGDADNRTYLGTRRFRTDPTNDDTDLDGLTDAEDRSPLASFIDFSVIVEFNQQDTDGDGVGDLQEADRDNDGFIDFRIARQSDVGGLAYDADTDTLFGVDSFNDQLLTLDPSTGQGTAVGDLGVTAANPSMQGLAFDANRGLLYGSDVQSDQLFTISPTTGQATAVGALGFDLVLGLAFDPQTNTLFGVDNGTDQLITIDVNTGAGTAVGAIGFDFVNGIDFDPETGVIFGTSISNETIVNETPVFTYQLLSINPATGQGTAIGDPRNDDILGLAVDPNTGTLFGTDIFTEQALRVINTTTGEDIVIGNLFFGQPSQVSERTMEERFQIDFDGDGTLDGFDLNENDRIDDAQLIEDGCQGVAQTNPACSCDEVLAPLPECFE